MGPVELPQTCTHDALICAIAQKASNSSSAVTPALHLPRGCLIALCAMTLLGAWGHVLGNQSIRPSVVDTDSGPHPIGAGVLSGLLKNLRMAGYSPRIQPMGPEGPIPEQGRGPSKLAGGRVGPWNGDERRN